MAPNIVVIGAGVVGLSTAVQIQASIPGCHITLVADKFNEQTTSDGAAGIFRPTLDKSHGTSPQKVVHWLKRSWSHFDALAHSPQAAEAGVSVFSGYQFFNDPSIQDGMLDKDIIYDFRTCTEKELSMFPNTGYKYGVKTTTLIAECRRYLPFLMKRFKQNGGRVECRTVQSMEEFVERYDVAVVCIGYGSRNLLADDKMRVNRGHLIRVHAPWIKQFIHCNDAQPDGFNFYIYPGADNVTIGGFRQWDDEESNPRGHEHDRIWERACEILPSLKDATVLWDWVGFRPFRAPLRLEKDVLRFHGSNTLPVVYNYGHGGEGVSLSWGTASRATELVLEQLQHSKL